MGFRMIVAISEDTGLSFIELQIGSVLPESFRCPSFHMADAAMRRCCADADFSESASPPRRFHAERLILERHIALSLGHLLRRLPGASPEDCGRFQEISGF